MFIQMNQALGSAKFEWQQEAHFLVKEFLVRLHAIFTLNQDLLLEQHYFTEDIMLSQSRKWMGWQLPGLRPHGPPLIVHDAVAVRGAIQTPDLTQMREKPELQPYYKLHGSSNWLTNTDERLLILGGNKENEISQNPLLHWYHKNFTRYLSKAATRLMVIGYGFNDRHINQALLRAGQTANLGLFIVDPCGADIIANSGRVQQLRDYIIGASRRPLGTIFGGDWVEHGKLMRFF